MLESYDLHHMYQVYWPIINLHDIFARVFPPFDITRDRNGFKGKRLFVSRKQAMLLAKENKQRFFRWQYLPKCTSIRMKIVRRVLALRIPLSEVVR